MAGSGETGGTLSAVTTAVPGGRLSGVLTGVALGVGSLVVGGYLLPSWLLLGCGVVVAAVGSVLLASRRWVAAFDRLFGRRCTTPVWLLLSVGVVSALSLALYRIGQLAYDTAVWTGVLGVSISILVTTALSSRRGSVGRSRYRLPAWTLVVGLGATGCVAWGFVRTGSPTGAVFFAAFAVFFLYVWFVVPLAIYQRNGTDEAPPPVEPYPTVSVIVPAYNEEGYVGRCIDHVLASDYPEERREVLVVDDGSTDGTYEEAVRRAGPGVTVHSKPNGGKHEALNDGLERTTGDVVVIVDADSFVEPDALSNVVGTFQAAPETGGLASDVRVRNRRDGVTRLQTLEYVLGINTFRRAFDVFGAVPVVPGCLGAFRREALADAGGYDGDTLTEDFDVTVKVLKAGWDVRQTPGTVWTEAPYSWRDLYRQRLRWNRGNVEVLLKHRDVFFGDGTRYLHRLVFPFYLLTLLLVPFVSVAVLAAVGVSLASGHAAAVAGMLAYFLFLGCLLSVLALRLTGESVRLVPYFVPLVTVYPLFQAGVIAMSVLDVLRNADRRWASVSRWAQEATADRASPDGDASGGGSRH
ncbi:glycosyltransferase [Halomarina pelagica]|uniref:glycosyltransferase n=1 Tax=Halomarina pelagica TaxID=2961599 RepID=UPI0020C5AF64|nr:glycosyltransferase family 2 protein [Halomarina sp. BND7]